MTKENNIERYFRWYCEELVQSGYVKKVDREAESLELVPRIRHKKYKHHKTKASTTEMFTLFPSRSYTYDFRIIWNDKALGYFTEILNEEPLQSANPLFMSQKFLIEGKPEIVSYVDVKPHSAAVRFGGGKMASYYTFPFVQRMIYDQSGVYINKTIPVPSGKHGRSSCLFAKSFTPIRYLTTDKSGDSRKIHFTIHTLSEFLYAKSKEYNQQKKLF